MGAAVGGSIESISLRGRLFPVAADADATLKLGGFENEVAANGDSSARIIKTRVPWSVSGIAVEINKDRADLEFLQEFANLKDYEIVTITMVSGATYQGRGMITGEVQMNTQSSTASLAISGPGEATQQ